MKIFDNFEDAYQGAKELFPAEHVNSQVWQGSDISEKPEMAMHEVLFYSFMVNMAGYKEVLNKFEVDIKPNMPWADRHFEERVCGAPINPGVEWENWPYAKSAGEFLDENEQFNHNYMERYWPRMAGALANPTRKVQDYLGKVERVLPPGRSLNRGIRHDYGDLAGVVRHLVKHPLTRQAYLPVWFPEDTGDVHEDRKPCTLGYHFIMRDGQLHVTYYIRSCDYVRHFRDDIYLTVRLVLWVLEQCREQDPDTWMNVELGSFVMHITSLHMFRNDYISICHE